MTSFEGESPSAVSDALAEAADPATVITDEAAERLELLEAEPRGLDEPLPTSLA